MTSAFTSLRNRFLLALGGVLCLALLALVLIARYQITPILLEDEARYAKTELDRAERALNSELGHMVRLVEDWAWWDDSYQFVQGQRPEYIDSNLYDGTLNTLDLRLMVFFSDDDQPYWVSGFNPADDAFTSCPGLTASCEWADEIIGLLQDRIEDGLEEDTYAWLLANPELAMIGLSPIYSSQEDAPPSGWMAMIRPLSEPWITQLRDTTGIDMTLTSIPVGNSSAQGVLERLSATRMQASRDIAAVPSSHRVRIDATLPRQRYQASLETFRFALYWTCGVLIVTLIVVLVLLEHMVLGPLRQFAHFTQRLQHDEDLDTTPSGLLARRDEIGTLAREFQHLREHQQQQKALLVDLSQHDPLTGLANRRLFDERLNEILDETRLRHDSVATLMVDVDHFKPYNDHYGHQAGDDCLVALADCMTRCFPDPDHLVARTGGEEFSILLPRTTLVSAIQQGEDLAAAIERLALPHATSPTADVVTISVGVAVSTPGHLLMPSALMRSADQALYAAKQAGRNRVHHRLVPEVQ
ncbi:GGDEF domain-containing protein [Litchfieldella rifensis]|uniref:diguanylate cyclase n=1 Tax=Litchfieldella rifensis TaxID=762643 RepID=A0ABV7LK41_9GAMM